MPRICFIDWFICISDCLLVQILSGESPEIKNFQARRLLLSWCEDRETLGVYHRLGSLGNVTTPSNLPCDFHHCICTWSRKQTFWTRIFFKNVFSEYIFFRILPSKGKQTFSQNKKMEKRIFKMSSSSFQKKLLVQISWTINFLKGDTQMGATGCPKTQIKSGCQPFCAVSGQ